MDFGDFEFNDSDFASDNQLSVVDDALMRILKKLKTVSNDAIESFKINNTTDAMNNIVSIFNDVSILHSLLLVKEQEDSMSDEEIERLIDEALLSTTELTYSNINDVIPQEDMTEAQPGADDMPDNSLDF